MVEINMNNRPLTIEEDIKMFNENMIEDKGEDLGWRKPRKYVKRCKDTAWRRWQREYVTALRERHNKIQHKSRSVNIDVRQVVMIKGESRKRGK